jgi:2-polyprenyl-3-methyl-5-hydroxy-6-metoxy-1,4-benzoquinol methylase
VSTATYTAETEMDICTFHSLQFVLSHVQKGQKLLEVGCGSGELALQLEKAGLLVTAIDKDENASMRAAAEGITVQEEDFFEYSAEKESFDVILFSRVLHHMHPLDVALEKVHTLLKPNGILLLDEFAVEGMDEKSATWFYGLKQVLAEAGTYSWSLGEQKIKDKFGKESDLEIWKQLHLGMHSVIDSETMRKELAKRFKLQSDSTVPYLYRYFADRRFRLKDELVPRVYEWECKLIQQQVLKPIGFYWLYHKA